VLATKAPSTFYSIHKDLLYLVALKTVASFASEI